MNRNYNNYNSYGGGGGGGQYQSQQMPGMQSWGHNQNDQLSSMDLELEMMKKKRLMLQEQRQLLQEQRQLQRMQQDSRPTNWNPPPQQAPVARFPNAPRKPYNANKNFASMYQPAQNQNKRRKRPAGQSAGGPSKKPMIERQVDEDVGPVEALPYPVYPGPDKATPSMRGRVEFALGTIVRDMRGNESLSALQVKDLKERVRQRLHRLLLDKPIGTAVDVVAAYRLVHTVRADRRLLETVLSKTSAPAVKEEAPNLFTPRAPRKNSTLPEKAEMAKTVKVYIHKLLEDRMDKLFDKLHAFAVEEASAKDTPPPISEDTLENETVKKESADGEEKKVEKGEEKETDGEKKEGEKEDGAGDDTNISGDAVPGAGAMTDSDKVRFIISVINRILVHKMPAMIHRYKRHMLSILGRDEAFRKLGLNVPVELPELRKTEVYKQIFYIKMVGKPALPQRNSMQKFLDQYKCISVKKHKSIFNLLFVGVPNEDSYHQLLAQDGVEIDGNKLEIRKSDHQKDVPKKTEQAKTEPNADGENGNTEQTEGNETADADNTEVNEESQEGNTEENGESQDGNIEAEENGDTGGEVVTSLDTEINDLLTSINDDGETKETAENKPEETTGRTRRSSRIPKN